MSKRVMILSNFNSYLKSYSPLIIVEEQINMFIDAGYDPVVIVTESFDAPDDSVFNKVKLARIPDVSVSTEAKQDISFESDIAFLKQTFRGIFDEHKPDVIITHDLIFLPDYVKHRIACLDLTEEYKNIRWLHWVHSATSPGDLINERKNFEDKYREMLGKKFPNSFLVYPNAFDVRRVASNFGYEEDEVKVVPHSTNFVCFNDIHPIIKALIQEKDLLSKDVIMVYPLRMDRGKQPHILVDIAYACNNNGMTSSIIYVDFHSTGGDKVDYREEIKKKAIDLNVDVTFLSEYHPTLATESDRKIVSDLFELSNFFVLPSMSETYSLVAQEAMLKGNFCVLNHDFAPMRSIYGDKAIYRQFCGKIGFDGMNGEITTTFSDEQAYWHDLSCYFKYVLENNPVVKGRTWVRQDRNPGAVFRKYIEPLLNGGQDEREDSKTK
jgi:hypothetical protein